MNNWELERREFLAAGGLAALALAVAPGRALAAIAGPSADARLNAVMDRIFSDGLTLSPQETTQIGLDKGERVAAKFKLDDASGAGIARNLSFHRHALAQLQAIAPQSLSAPARRHRQLAIYLQQQAIEPARLGLASAQTPYPISQQYGVYFEVPDFLDSNHVVATAGDAEAYLSRLAGFARALDDQAHVQQAAASRGLIAPGWSLDLALGQIRALRAPAPEANSLTLSLARRTREKGIPGDWQARAAKIVAGEVYPALDRHAALLSAMKTKSAPGDGIWRVRDGDAIYAMALALATTTSLSPDEVHRIGLDQVADLTARLDTVLKSAGYAGGSVGARLSHLNVAPDQLYPNTDEGRAAMIASLNAGVAAMRARLPQAFNNPPNEPLEIRRVPPGIQDGAPNGYYYRATLDGSRPAIYWINLKDTADWPRYQLPDLTYHEGIPGHHLQLGYVQHSGELPMLLRNVFISAYGEGWALYAEQLAAELGAMQGLEQAGYLQSLLFRATRLVVDTGIHHKRWSREQATRYMVETTGYTQGRSQREIDRYCTMIGQACSYKIGHNTWLRLREKAKSALGDKFTLPWFHDVLKDGLLPLSMLETRVDERIAERMRA